MLVYFYLPFHFVSRAKVSWFYFLAVLELALELVNLPQGQKK